MYRYPPGWVSSTGCQTAWSRPSGSDLRSYSDPLFTAANNSSVCYQRPGHLTWVIRELLTPLRHHRERNTVQHGARPRRENGLDVRDLQPLANPCNPLFLPYKEGVAGSNPASPTKKLPANSSILRAEKRAGKRFPALLLQPCCIRSWTRPDRAVKRRRKKRQKLLI